MISAKFLCSARSKLFWLTGIIALLVIIPACILLIDLYATFNPAERVRVQLINIPSDVYFACVVSKSDSEIRIMEWYPESEIMTCFPMHPADCIWSFRDGLPPSDESELYVRWRPASSYGIVTRNTECVWKITWFSKGAIGLEHRSKLFAGGEARFDYDAGVTQMLEKEDLQKLGLQSVRKPLK